MAYKVYSTNYLMKLTKAEIIDILRTAEHNYIATEEALTRSADYGKGLLKEIEQLKKADVHPAKRGHWYHNISKYISELDAYFIQACCSCCGRYSDKIDQYSQIMSNETCSHCGADMRGEGNG